MTIYLKKYFSKTTQLSCHHCDNLHEMKNSHTDILIELRKLSSKLEEVSQKQDQLKEEMSMIFSDIACFEHFILKMMDGFLQKKQSLEKYDH